MNLGLEGIMEIIKLLSKLHLAKGQIATQSLTLKSSVLMDPWVFKWEVVMSTLSS